MNSEKKIAVLAPFLLEARFVERVWGTTDLRPWYDWVAADGEQPVGEIWLTGDTCRVLTGELKGKELAAVFAERSEAMLGESAPEAVRGASPLLLKVIFAKEKLSVQVHPDDKLAQKYGDPRGKTECWYALHADAGAEVAVGLLSGVTLDQIEREVADGTLEKSLQVLPVEDGDMLFVDAGTVHAIWPGSVLLETQQNCDLTYRLFDYGRPRELHVAKALEATRLETSAGKVKPVALEDRTVLVDRDYFRVEKIPVDGSRTGASFSDSPLGVTGPGLQYLFAGAGSGRVVAGNGVDFDAVELPTRGVVAVPAGSPEWLVEDAGGLELIRITARWPEASV